MANEIAKKQANAPAPVNINTLMSNVKVKNRFEEILGKKAPGFISSVLSVAKSPVLIGSDPQTIMSAAVVAATLDLPINPNLGFAYIVPYNDKNAGKQAQFQMGYKGFIQLAMRTGQYKTINATDVREGEIVNENLMSGEIEFKKLPSAEREKAKVIGYAAYFRLLNGFEKTLYMTKEEVDAHGKKYSMTYKRGFGLWATAFDAMAKKTVLKLLLSKYGPLSIEMQMAQTFDQSVIRNLPDNLDVENAEVEYIDNIPEEVSAEETPAELSAVKAAAMAAASAQFQEQKKAPAKNAEAKKESDNTNTDEVKAPF